MSGWTRHGEVRCLRIAAYFEVPVEVIFSTEPFPRLGWASA
jgi:hypothetical protein